MIGGGRRQLIVHAPPRARGGARPSPLILAFHGAGGSARDLKRFSGLDAAAEREGFVVAYLDAPLGNWAEGCGCNNADRLGVDDLGFVAAVIDALSSEGLVDRARVYAVGYSQGGLFAQRLACEMADRITAVAAVSGLMSAPLAQRCAPSRPVSVLAMHGTRDPIFGVNGSGSGKLEVLGASRWRAAWAALNRCSAEPDRAALPDVVVDNVVVRREAHDGCAEGSEVSLYLLDGGGHGWPGASGARADAPASETIVAFFRGHVRP